MQIDKERYPNLHPVSIWETDADMTPIANLGEYPTRDIAESKAAKIVIKHFGMLDIMLVNDCGEPYMAYFSIETMHKRGECAG